MPQQETIEWRPVSEGLPEEVRGYLVTYASGYVDKVWRLQPWERTDGHDWAYRSNGRLVPAGKVIAWARSPRGYQPPTPDELAANPWPEVKA